MTRKLDRFDAYLARKQAQSRRAEAASLPAPTSPSSPILTNDFATSTRTEQLSPPVDATSVAAQSPATATTDTLRSTQITPPLSAISATNTEAHVSDDLPARPRLLARHDAEWRRDLQILALHQKMLEKLQQHPTLVPYYLDKLEQRKQLGRMRHAEYLFWYCALSQWQHQSQALASLLSMEPGPRKYRRRTLLAGLLTEDERQQILLGHS